MFQTLVERVTGISHDDDLGVEVQLVMDAPTIVDEEGEPVELVGYGPISPISPDVAEDIIARAPARSVRRLLVNPVDGTLIVREPRRRLFDPPARAASVSATAGAANPAATARSATPTTSTHGPTADPRPSTTPKDSAPGPTRSSTNPAGRDH